MDGRVSANSSAMKGLLGRQLASITDTLAKASQRRDAEMKKRTTSTSANAPVKQTSFAPSPTNPSLISDTEDTGGSDYGDSVLFGGHQTRPNIQEFGRFDLALPQANSIMDDTTPPASLHGDYASDDNDPKMMLAHFGKTGTSTGAQDDPKDMLAQLDGINTAASTQEENDSKKTLAELSQIDTLLMANDDNSDKDIASMLADLDRASSVGQSTIHGEAEDIDPKQLLAEFGVSTPSHDEAHVHTGGDDNPRRMLAELEWRTYFADDANPRRMFADFERKTPTTSHEPTDDEDDNLEALRGRLTNMLSPANDQKSPLESIGTQLSSGMKHDRCEPVFNKAVIPYIVALQLESAGIQWEEAQGWTTYLFSNGLDGHKARQNKDEIMKQSTHELDKIIKDVICEEKHYLNTENKVRQPRRLIVSNMAADAGEEDLKEFFYHFRFVVQELKVLPERDPIRRTKVAHIDMLTRDAAIQASFMTGGIFGLMLDIKLAVEKED